ncbi:capsular polysaccharide export protein, LipB/KpsS family [Rhizobium sp. RAF56]|uniref:capsular polysaccharide export protein, LipB/KpsS family n=1 Tax=Rhizobium sp. RAF56 TaxID=3233062 RepID=UPI003F9BDBD9
MEKILVFRLPGAESAENTRLLCDTLRGAGKDPLIVPYWDDGEALHGEDSVFLLPGGFEASPRLSDYAFHQKFGFSLDLIDLSAHSLAAKDIRTDTVLMESVWSQHLRGLALIADDLMRRLAPKVVFIAHGAEVVSRILAVMAAHRRIPYVYWESPFFPGFHFADPYSPHFFRGDCRFDRFAKSQSFFEGGQDELDETAAFARGWRENRLSKYPQISDEKELAELRAWAKEQAKPILFIPGQIAHDANVTISLRGYPDLHAIYDTLIDCMPDGWRAIFKPHPKSSMNRRGSAGSDRVRVVSNVSIHDLFDLSDAVATHSSNVGLEALLAGIPVLVWGDPIYARRGLTTDLADVRMVPDALSAASSLVPPPREKVLLFLWRLLRDCLVKQGDGPQMAIILAEASVDPPKQRLPWYGSDAQALARAARSLEAALKNVNDIRDALAELSSDDRLLLNGYFHEDLLPHRFGGPRVETKLSPLAGYEADLPALFREALLQEILPRQIDLANSHDPRTAFRELVSVVTERQGVIFTTEMALRPDWAIQKLSIADIKGFFDMSDSAVQVEMFGLGGTTLTIASDDDPCIAVLLRDRRLPGLSDTERDKLTTSILAYRPFFIPHNAFNYRDPPVLRSQLRLVPLEGQGHVIFGPHLPLAEGRWRVTFLMKFKRGRNGFFSLPPRNAALVTLDVYTPATGIAAAAKLDLGHLDIATLQFDVKEQCSYEFRVFSHSDRDIGTLIFEGVQLEHLDDRAVGKHR